MLGCSPYLLRCLPGDSGGPLSVNRQAATTPVNGDFLDDRQAGIVSFGTGCGLKGEGRMQGEYETSFGQCLGGWEFPFGVSGTVCDVGVLGIL